MIKIQVNMQGFCGKGCSLFGAYDPDSGVLIVAKFTGLNKRREDCVFISSDYRDDYDSLFSVSNIADAIESYQYLKSKKLEDEDSFCLRFSPSAMAADPSSSVELDGVDGGGSKYRISIDASNMSIASLAMCHYVRKSIGIDDVLEVFSEFENILNGEVVTL